MTEMHPRRRDVLYAIGATGALAGCGGDDGTLTGTAGGDTDTATSTSDADTATPTDGGEDLGLTAEAVADGFASPVDVAAPSAGELLVVDQVGTVTRVLEDVAETGVVLDISDRIVDVGGVDERGLLGIALHPDYAENGRVFLRYSAPPREGTPNGYSHTFVLSEFGIDPEDVTIDPDTEEPILEIPEPQGNHNAGPIAFGPEGYLYVPVGDGGAGNDQGDGHVEDWYDAVEGGNGQDVTENLLGSILRIDVDGEGDDGQAYAIPDDNPLVGAEGLDEHYAWGTRNPYGLTFDSEGRGVFVDVGQSSYEEVNVLESGGNYGWNVREGHECFQADDCPGETPDGDPLIDPVVAYPRGGEPVSGIAAIGGQVYEGDAIPTLQGTYVFGDWQSGGELFVASDIQSDEWGTRAVPVSGALKPSLLATGTDANGELLVLSSEHGQASGDTGVVARLAPE